MTIRLLLNDTPYLGPSALTVTLRGRLTCRCPVNGRQDAAVVEVTYQPTASLIELESFAGYLASFRDRAATHETVTAEILMALNEETGAGCNGIAVTTTWEPVEGVECVVTARL